MLQATSPYVCAQARARLYALLCLAAAPPEPQHRDWLRRRLPNLARWLGPRLPFPGPTRVAELSQGLRLAPGQELAAEHLRLEQAAPPYESYYRNPEGLLMGESARAVVQAYRDAGLAPAAGWRDLPDRLEAELEFMAHLAEREAVCWRRRLLPLAGRWLALEERFLANHLCRWVPAYADRVCRERPLAYFRSLAGLLEQTVQRDLCWVGGLSRRVQEIGSFAAVPEPCVEASGEG